MTGSEIMTKEIDYPRISKHIAECGECGKHIIFDSKNKYYYCSGRKNSNCRQPYIKQDILELDFKILAAELQRITRKSGELRKLKGRLKKEHTKLVKDIERYDRQLDKEAKNILMVDDSKPLKTLRFEVDEVTEMKGEQTKLEKRLDAIGELYSGLHGLWSLVKRYEVDYCPATLFFKKMIIRDQQIAGIALMPGMDYLVQLIRSDVYYAGKPKIHHDKSLLRMDFNGLLDKFGAHMMESCINYKHRPSDKTLRRHFSADDSRHQTLGERLMLRILMFINRFEPFKSMWDRMENPTEREQALEFALSLESSPSLYAKGGPLVAVPENAIENLEQRIERHDWLLEHQQINPELCYEWEDKTRHLIGKIFGFKSEPYSMFLAKADFLKSFRKRDSDSVKKRFLDDASEKRKFLAILIRVVRGLS